MEEDQLFYADLKYKEIYEVPLRVFKEKPQAESYEGAVPIYIAMKENGDLKLICGGIRIFYDINEDFLTLSTRY